MNKLYLLLDEWDNDRNFVGYELEELMKHYEVTVICNSASAPAEVNGDFVIYEKPGKPEMIGLLLKGLADRDLIREIRKVIKGKINVSRRVSEVLHFYINAAMFRSFMTERGYLEDKVIYYSYWYFWKCYAVTGVLDRFPASRIITRAHGYDLYDEVRPSGYQPFKEIMDKRISKIAFISEYGRDYYLKRYKKNDPDKYVLSCLGTGEPEGIGPYEKNGEISLVSCSHMIPLKRIHLIVEALAITDDVDVKWVHFGDGKLADELGKTAKERLGTKENIRYEFKGQVDNSKIHDFYLNNKVDAFITTSGSEGNPVSVMEAMSYGIPVIAPAICNFQNMVGEAGILLSPECRADETCAAIRRFKSMPDEEIAAMRSAARRIWEEKYDRAHNSRVFIDEVLINC